MRPKNGARSIDGGANGDVLLGTRKGDIINGYAGDDLIDGGRGVDVMTGGEGSDIFRFDDKDAGDVTFGKADVITDFGADDVIDLLAVDILYLDGLGYPEPFRGGLSLWQANGNSYVSWKTFGTYHDIELTGYTGDLFALLGQIRWYEDDYSGSRGAAEAISPGQTVQGNIEQPSDQDWFKIDVTAGNLYAFDLQGEADEGGTLKTPALILYDEDGNYVTDAFDDLFFEAGVDGTYYISATTYESTGSYTLEVAAEPYSDDFAGDVTTEGRIASGGSVTGVIGRPFDFDWFSIDLEAGQTYTFSLLGEVAGGGTLTLPVVSLFDGNGGWLTESLDTLSFIAESDGAYFVSAGSYSASGTYTLTVESETNVDDTDDDDVATERAIALGETVAGTPGDQGWLMV